ncbi:MAG: Ribonuclease VapC19 [Candidatus Hydrogenedentes bacterium ADurb.Bin101]|nr:MAG: Ribonuclease VapC19 [Candidatus Hydrogenedentes bacterium ADurb.Bin101]
MILLDSDIMIDLLRQYPPAVHWFDLLDEEEQVLLPGYTVMELMQGCRNQSELTQLQETIEPCAIVWPLPDHCDTALALFSEYRLSHQPGMLDILIGQTAVSLGLPLHTFNQKHFSCIPGLQTVQPYRK